MKEETKFEKEWKQLEIAASNMCNAFKNYGVSVDQAACSMNSVLAVIKRLEKTDPIFKAQMDYMRYRCLPWYKKIWLRLGYKVAGTKCNLNIVDGLPKLEQNDYPPMPECKPPMEGASK